MKNITGKIRALVIAAGAERVDWWKVARLAIDIQRLPVKNGFQPANTSK